MRHGFICFVVIRTKIIKTSLNTFIIRNKSVLIKRTCRHYWLFSIITNTSHICIQTITTTNRHLSLTIFLIITYSKKNYYSQNGENGDENDGENDDENDDVGNIGGEY